MLFAGRPVVWVFRVIFLPDHVDWVFCLHDGRVIL